MKVKRGKRFIGFVLSLVLMLGMMPQMSRAVKAIEALDTDLVVAGVKIGKGGDVPANTPGVESGTAVYDKDNKILTLTNFVYSGEGWWTSYPFKGAAIYGNVEGLTIKVTGTCSLVSTVTTDNNSYGIYNNSSTQIQSGENGTGTLIAKGADNSNSNSYGIWSLGNLKIDGCIVNAYGGTVKDSGKVSDGIETNGTLTVTNNGVLHAEGADSAGNSYGISSNNSVTLNNEAECFATSGSAGINSYGISTRSTVLVYKATLICSAGKVQTGDSSGISIMGGVDNSIEIFNSAKLVVISGENKAATKKVKNQLAGTGWTDAEGTEGKTKITKLGSNDTGVAWDYKRVQFPEIQKVKTPVFTPKEEDKTYETAQTVTISCDTKEEDVYPGEVEIHYTVDGSDPTRMSDKYTGPITLSETKTIKAIAVKKYMEDSAVAEATYKINNPQPKPDPKPDPKPQPKPEPVVTTSIKTAEITDVLDRTVNGSAQTQKPTVTLNGAKLTEGTDYTISYSNNVNAGTATMTVTGIGKYTDSKSVNFKILTAKQAKEIKNVQIFGTKDLPYTGKAVTQKNLEVYLGGKLLKNNKDYTVSYKNNKNVGKATFTIKAKGKTFKGSKTQSFKVIKAENSLIVSGKDVSLKAKDVNKKAQTIPVKKVIPTKKKGQGKVTYKKTSGDANIKVDPKSGKVTVAKKTPADTYKIEVNVKAAGDKNHKACTIPVSFTVKIS